MSKSNKPHPFNWFFNWKGFGYNSVSAVNREEALAKAKELGKPNGSMTVTLEVDESSLQPDPDRKLTSEWDRKTASMFY